MGGQVHYIPNIAKVGPLIYAKNLKHFFKKHPEYQILHTHFTHYSGLIVKIAYKCNVSTRIVHCHNTSTNAKGLKLLYKKYVKRYIKKYATDLFACGNEAAKYMYGSSPAIIIKNGIDIEKYKFNKNIREKYRKELKIKDSEIVLGSVGRLCEQKNPLFLLKIFNEYQKIIDNSKLLIIGDGPLLINLLNEIKKLNLEKKVIILKDVNALEYYNVMDYFLLPSLFEGLPFVLIESQVNGLPTFASLAVTLEANVSKKIEYIDLEKGEKYWAKKIYETNSKRYDCCERIKKAGYDINITSKWLENFYLKR